MPTVFTTTGFAFSLDEDEDFFTTFQPGAIFGVSFADADPVLNYSFNYGNSDVDLGGSQPLVATINGALLPDDIDPSIFRFTSETGDVTDILSIMLSPTEEYMFRIGGAELPNLTSAAAANAFFFYDDMNAFSNPSGATGPGVDIPYATMPGWDAVDTSGAQTITLRGFSLADEPGPPNPATAQPSEFQLTFAQPGANLTQEFIELDDEGGARVNFRFDQQPISLLLNGEPLPFVEIDEFELGSVRFVSGGQVYDALILDDFANDRIHFIQLGGEPLPEGTPAAVAAFLEDGIEFSQIPPGQPTSYDTPIPLADIPGAVVTEAEPVAPELAALAEASNLAELETALAAFAATQEGLDIPAERLSQLAGDLMLYRNTAITLDWNGTVVAVEDDAEDDFAVDDTVSGRYRFNLPLARYGDDLLGGALDPNAIFQYEQFGLAGSGFSVAIPDLRLNSPSLRMQTFEFNAAEVDGSTLLADLFGTDASLLEDGQTYTELMVWLSSAVGVQDDITGDFAISGTEVTMNLILPGVVGLEAFIDQLDQIPLTYVDVTYTFADEEVGKAFVRADTISASSVVPLPDSPELLVDIVNALMEARDAFDAVVAEANDHALTVGALNDLRESANTLFELLGGSDEIDNSFFGAPYLAGEQLPEAIGARLQLFHDLDPNQKVSFLAAFNAQERTYDSVTEILRAPEFLALADGSLALPDPSGNPGIVRFDGWAIFEDDDDNLVAFNSVEVTLALPFVDALYSYVAMPDAGGDGPDLVDILGPQPYALLLDGLQPRGDLTIGIERITVDGIAYDLVLLQTDLENATFVFQIDGATPLPFTSFEAVEAFIEAADEDDAFGLIPDGPFAPGAAFRFGDSPYATPITDPQIIEGGVFWRGTSGAEYGRGTDTAGSLTVVNGAAVTLNADGANGPFMSVGRDGGYGAITVAGSESSLDLVAGGGSAFPDEGASVSIGRNGGSGGLRVLDDARFSITDPTGTTAGPDFDGHELLWVGRGPGGNGYVDVISARFEHMGTGTIAAYGRDGGDGYLYVAAGGTYRQETTSDSDFTQLAIGRDGGFGEAEINYGRLTVQAAENGDGSLEIGLNSGGYDAPGGILRIFGDGDGTHGAMMVGGANSPFVEVVLGRNGGGLVDVSGGYFGVLNRGVSYDDELHQSISSGDGGDAEMTIGRDGGRGMIVANDSAEVFVSGTDSARMQIGAGDGSLGEVFMNGSELRVYSMNGEGGVAIGAWDGGTGSMTLNGASDADIWGANGAFLNVGRDAGNFGTLVLSEMSDILVRGDSNFTSVEIGAFGGSGQVSVLSGAHLRADGVNSFLGIGRTSDTDTSGTTNGTLVVNGEGSRVYGFRNVNVGEHDARGTLRVENGAAVQLGVEDGSSSLFVGRHAGSDGTLVVSNALMSIHAPDGGAEPYTAFGYMGGSALVDIDGERGLGGAPSHGFIQLGGGDSAFATLDIGRGAGANGVVHVNGAFFGTQNNGTEFRVDPAQDLVSQDGDGGRAVLRIGVQGGIGSLNAGIDSEVFANGGADGAAMIVGESEGSGIFNLSGGSLEIEGEERVAFLGIGSGGVGEMTMSNGARGWVDLMSADPGFGQATIAIGYEGNAGGGYGNGTLLLRDSGTRLDVFSEVNANLHVGGIENGAGDGLLRIEEDATLSFESVEHQQLNIGRADGNGVLEVLSGGSFLARTTGESFDTFMLVGTEGGSGTVRVDNGSLSLVSEGGNAGIRVGTRWTDTLDNTGTGSLLLENGADVVIEGAVSSNFWVGGLAGSNGDAIIRSGSALTMVGDDNFAIIGGVFGVTDDEGGSGRLEVTGAGSGLTGADILLVGYNNGAGTLEISDGAMVAVDGGAPGAFLGIGVHSSTTGNGGTGSATVDGTASVLAVRGPDAAALVGGQGSTGTVTVTNGAQVKVEATSGSEPDAMLDIGRDGGSGTVSLSGASSVLSVADTFGSAGVIRVAAEGSGSTGLLHVATGANVVTGLVQVGSSAASSGVLALDDGLVTGAVSVFENGWFGGTGAVTGDVTVSAGSFRVGDLFDASEGEIADVGSLNVTGDVTLRGDANANFEVGSGGSDFLSVGGALNINGSEINVSYLDVFDPALGPVEFRIAQADGGITLDAVTLTSMFDTIDGFEAELELREGDTELWFTAGPSTVTVSGMVSVREVSEGAVGRQGTQVSFNTEEHGSFMATTDASGAFSFDVPVGASGTLELVRDYDPGVDKALSVDDVIALFQLVMHPDPASVYSPLDMLAADFDRDGQATVDDVIALFGHVMSVPGAAEPGYVFIDSNNPPTAVDTADIPLPEAFVVAPLVANSDLSLTAILSGDLFGYHT